MMGNSKEYRDIFGMIKMKSNIMVAIAAILISVVSVSVWSVGTVNASDIEACITQQWGSDPAPIKIFGKDVSVGAVVSAPLREGDEKYQLRAFEDPFPTYSLCQGYGYYRDGNLSVISRLSLLQNKVLVQVRHDGGRGNYPGSAGYIEIINPEWKITEVLAIVPPPTDQAGDGVIVDKESGRIEWSGRGACPACACREGCTFISFVVEKNPAPPVTRVTIDIKPSSDPNCFNNDGHGVIPVAILSDCVDACIPEGGFDATQVDPGTVELEALAVRTVGKSDKLQAHIEDVNNDGCDDLVVQIVDQDGAFEGGETEATLTGNLYDVYGGTAIEGTDTICIVP